MIYTLCWDSKNLKIDIKVNREQKIADTMLILFDGGVLPTDFNTENRRIFSKRKNEYIDTGLSYENAKIFNGDVLYIR